MCTSSHPSFTDHLIQASDAEAHLSLLSRANPTSAWLPKFIYLFNKYMLSRPWATDALCYILC